MAKLYWTSEMKKLFDEKITNYMNEVLFDRTAKDHELVNAIHEFWLYKDFADDVIADMEEADRKEDEERAAREAMKQEEQKNATDS